MRTSVSVVAIATTIAAACSSSDPGPPDARGFATHPAWCDSNSECMGQMCISVPASTGFFQTCDVPTTEATGPSGSANDDCSTSADCAAGSCYPSLECVGSLARPVNYCLSAECVTDNDCSGGQNGICVRSGAFALPASRCLYGDCRDHDDCSAQSGGECTIVVDSCDLSPQGTRCVYPTDECHSDTDCDLGAGQRCDFNVETRPVCVN